VRRSALVSLAILMLASTAAAQPTAEDRVLATDLFQRGRDLMAEGRILEACDKLAASQALDPSGGTVLNLALCHEQLGRTATAWSEFREAASFAKRDQRSDRLRFAEEHLSSLEPKLVRVSIIVTEDAPDLVVVRDTTVLPRTAWAIPTPIDPGVHTIEARAPGRRTWRETIDVSTPGATREVRVPRLDPPMPSFEASVGPRSPGTARPTPVLTYAFAIASVAGASFGSVAAARAITKRHASDAECAPTCSEEGVALNDQAKTAADVATVGFTLAAAAAVTAVVLYLTRPAVVVAPRSALAQRGFVVSF
jgi:hypothetical protein